MKIKDINKVFFLGIGGIGMSALARYFHSIGKTVSGYDKTPTLLTHELEEEGLFITYLDSIDTLIKDADLVVYTPAIPKNHQQLNYYKEHHFVVKKRAEVLGLIANEHFNVSIAGSHGKTSTSSLIAHILHQADKDVAAFLGGICLNFNSNFISGNTISVTEADEFDRSFLQLTPDIALVTSVDTDHLDIYGNFDAIQESFRQFLAQVRNNGSIFLHESIDRKIANTSHPIYTYSYQNDNSDYYASNIKVIQGATHFDLNAPNTVIKDLILNYGGKHNAENAIGASAVTLKIGITEEELRQGLMTFLGVRRRFQTIYQSERHLLIDDYAHHPREIDAVIQTVRNLYPHLHLTVIFQPHLYSRTRDLADEFGHSLSASDRVVLFPIYPARELPIEGVSSQLIFDAIEIQNKDIVEKDQLLDFLSKLEKTEIIMTIGAGDIDQYLIAISNWLKESEK
ncbi:MAG: UDP-N-acetylmuramate--L-alanine ligase [Chitinophagales bacterium]|nr:UDP-N-acetylmuramate--L-alanine ligase [Chitinophagales bacterium]